MVSLIVPPLDLVYHRPPVLLLLGLLMDILEDIQRLEINKE